MNNRKSLIQKKAKLYILVAVFLPGLFSAQFTQTFVFTGSMQTFVVPTCVNTITMSVKGAQGAGNSWPGGYGGLATGVASVTPGQVLYIFVGGQPASTSGGYNGGGSGGLAGLGAGKGGGGASDVRMGGFALGNRIIVGGGGGGCNGLATYGIPTGGNGGGGSVCAAPNGVGGGGGNGGTAGGIGGCSGGASTAYGAGGGGGGLSGGGLVAGSGTGGYGQAGSLGQGGDGGDVAGSFGGGGGGTYGGGGGGGGYYGGAGGMSVGAATGGGGGGSSYCDPTIFSNISFSSTSSFIGNGVVTFSYTILSPISVTLSSTAICSGSSATISASGSQSYTWSTSAPTSSIVVSPTTTTNYTVAGSNSAGCVTSSVISVAVNSAAPSLSISGAGPVCLGQTLALTATGALSYSWTSGIINAQPFAPLQTGSYVVTGQNACGSATATANVSVTQLPVSIVANSSSVCVGGTLALSGVSSGNTFTWAPQGFSTQTAIVSPSVSTVYTLSSGNGTCLGNAFYTVSALPAPTITCVHTGSNICVGATTTLGASGGVSYTWNPGGLTGASISVSPLVSTQYVVNGTGQNGCTANTVQVVVAQATPTLLVWASQSGLCAGNTTTLMVSGANYYTWLNTGANSTAVAFSPTATTIYSVTGTDSNGCASTGTLSVYVLNPNVTIGGNTVLCLGESTTLTATGAATYTWSNGVPLGAIAVSPTTNTVYTVSGITYSNSVSCYSSASATVVVHPLPNVAAAADRSIICAGESVTISASGAATYSWNVPQGNGQNFVFSPQQSSLVNLNVIGVSSLGCRASASVPLQIKSCTDTKEWASSAAYLQVYPNPAGGEGFYVELEPASLRITDVNGRQIDPTLSYEAVKNRVFVTGLKTGVYFVYRVENGRAEGAKLLIRSGD